jgi:hypothetical protein
MLREEEDAEASICFGRQRHAGMRGSANGNPIVSHGGEFHALMVVRGEKYAEVKRHPILSIYVEAFVFRVKCTLIRRRKSTMIRYFV